MEPAIWTKQTYEERLLEFDAAGNQIAYRMRTTDRAGVLKIKYLYFF